MRFLNDILIEAGLIVNGTVQIDTIPAAVTDTDKFMVSDGGVMKSRTGAQVASDIDAMTKAVYDTDGDGIVDDAEKITVIARNSTGSTIYKGTIVYLQGSTGNRPNMLKAQANSEPTSSRTFGVVVDDVANNADGQVAALGTLHDLDTRSGAPNPFTSDTLVDGDAIWLSPATAGYVTRTKPTAPNHAVFIGIVARTSPTNGRIVYRIQNGFELEELHNVSALTPNNNDGIFYNSTTGLWEAKSIATAAGGTIGTVTSVAMTVPTGLQIGGSPITTSGTLALTYASGYAIPTTVKQSNWDDAYTWVSNFPTQTGNSGKYLTTDGNTLSWATVTAGISGSGTTNYLPKWTGATALGNSQIFDNGTSVGIGTATPSATYLFDVNGTSRFTNNTSNAFVVDLGLTGVFKVLRNNVAHLQYDASTYTTTAYQLESQNLYTFASNTTRIGGGVLQFTGSAYINAISQELAFWLGGSEKARFAVTTGNLLLNTTTDAGYKLDVNGTARGTSFYSDNYRTYSTAAGQTISFYTGSNIRATLTDTGGGNLTVIGSITASGGQIQPGTRLLLAGGANIVANYQDAVLSRNGPNSSSLSTLVLDDADGPSVSGYQIQRWKTGGVTKAMLDRDGNFVTLSSSYVGSIGAINASAIIQADSTTKGFLPPRMTSTQLAAIATPAVGLVVYQTDGTEGLYEYTSSGWRRIYSTGSITGSGTTNYLPKWTSSTALGDSLIFDNGTNVGIGTTSPTASSGRTLEIRSSTDSFGGVLYLNNLSSTARGFVAMFNNTAGLNVGTETNHNFSISTNGSTRSTVFANGNFAIGTTTDAGYKLDVNGTLRSTGNALINTIAIRTVSVGTNNYQIGNLSQSANLLSGANTNLMIGQGIGTYFSTPQSNVVVGYNIFGSGANNVYTSPLRNTIIGASVSNGDGNGYNTNDCVAIGQNMAVQLGFKNIFIGNNIQVAGFAKEGEGSILIGYGTSAGPTNGYNTVIGHNSIAYNSLGTLTGWGSILNYVSVIGAGTTNYNLVSNAIFLGRLNTDDTYVGRRLSVAGSGTPTYVADITGTLRSTADAYFATSSGAVGIGTTSPVYTLDVNGTGRVSGNTYLATTSQTAVNIGSSNFSGTLSPNASYLFWGGSGVLYSSSAGPDASITNNGYYDGSANRRVRTGPANGMYLSTTGDIIFTTAGSGASNSIITYTDVVSIKNNGNFLIGTTTDAGYKLDVNGTGRINGVQFSTNANIRIIEYNHSAGFIIQNTAGPMYLNGTMTVNRTGDVQIYNNFASLRYISISGSYKINTNDGYGNLYGLNIGADGTRVMQIFNGGNVGFQKGIDYNSTNEASALVQVNSTTQGFLPPRMTSAQRAAISTPAVGLVVYQTDGSEGLYENTSTGWRIVNAAGAGSGVTGTGTTNYLSKWTASTALGDSSIYDDGTNVALGTSTLVTKSGKWLQITATSNVETSLVLNRTGGVSDARWDILVPASSNALRFYNSNAGDVATITNGGNVLIGTTTDSGYKLDVNGTARVSSTFYLASNVSASVNSYGGPWWQINGAGLKVENDKWTSASTNGSAYIINGANDKQFQVYTSLNSNTTSYLFSNGNALADTTSGWTHKFIDAGLAFNSSAANTYIGIKSTLSDVSTSIANNVYAFYADLTGSGNASANYYSFYSAKGKIYNAEQVGIGTASPNASAKVDISSTTQGFLPPRMTAAQKNAISTPATGLIVYQTDGTAGLYVYTGAAWKSLAIVA